ncbi:MAG TPA: MarR family transcriptional regulator [Bacillus sp. (in: firmicutes)]|uniref:MarR family winged helix-turn-helix transcriptional regulator n=1 Tax=Bacillus litorisediminis TaxID=2922713 RepID=UPI001FABE54F|nr:MarR family transcriptional regulator [Bacillus litorisediminis]HWO78286.1 MarR family transcriptional regulator [Bacillus sp. (in: firmicutes)]
MEKDQMMELVDRYVSVSFQVTNKAEALINNEIGADLTYDQHYILRYIHNAGKCTSTELAEAFDVNKSAITAIITRLTNRELIKRTRDPEDRRVVYLTLTEKGNELFSQTQQKVQKLFKRIITQFNDEEIAAFIQTYEKLLQAISDIQEKGELK